LHFALQLSPTPPPARPTFEATILSVSALYSLYKEWSSMGTIYWVLVQARELPRPHHQQSLVPVQEPVDQPENSN
jgi:hypothetical protein